MNSFDQHHLESKEQLSLICHYLWSGKATTDPPILIVDKVRNDSIDLDDTFEAETEKLVKNDEMP